MYISEVYIYTMRIKSRQPISINVFNRLHITGLVLSTNLHSVRLPLDRHSISQHIQQDTRLPQNRVNGRGKQSNTASLTWSLQKRLVFSAKSMCRVVLFCGALS